MTRATRSNHAELVSTEAESDLVRLLGAWAAGSGSLYVQLAAALRSVLERDLPVGTTLPPERRLAQLLHVSRTTVVGAYGILRREGLVESRRGSGTRVAEAVHSPPVGHALALASVAGFRSLIAHDREAIDLSAAGIGADGVFGEDMLAEATEELATLTHSVGYLPYGLPALRAAVARHLSACGLDTDPRQILITNGAQQALSLTGQLYAGRGSVVLVENPTYAGALDAFNAAGARIIGIPVEEQVSSVESLRRVLNRERPRLLYLMPSFQNPTGTVSTAARRRQLADLAAAHDLPLVEDDALSPLAIDQSPPPPLAALDTSGTVISIGSLSKLVWAGLRVGWIRAHPRILDRLVRLKTVNDLAGSLPSQALARAAITDIHRISMLRQEQLVTCRRLATTLLRRQLPEWRFKEPRGGMSLWLRLPGADADAFAHTALEHGVVVVPGSLLSPDRTFRDHLRVQFLQPEPLLEQGIARLAQAWEEYTGTGHQEDLAVIV
jgi:DNA-binding transcriptional MocR family regulator